MPGPMSPPGDGWVCLVPSRRWACLVSGPLGVGAVHGGGRWVYPGVGGYTMGHVCQRDNYTRGRVDGGYTRNGIRGGKGQVYQRGWSRYTRGGWGRYTRGWGWGGCLYPPAHGIWDTHSPGKVHPLLLTSSGGHRRGMLPCSYSFQHLHVGSAVAQISFARNSNVLKIQKNCLKTFLLRYFHI